MVIDDGSPDKSGAIADQAASLDARLTVFHQPHRGVSAARNVGLEMCIRDRKCERCWKHLDSVGSNPNHPDVCARCARVLDEEK